MRVVKNEVSTTIVKKTFKSILFAQLFSMLAEIIAVLVDGIITGKCLGTENLAAYGFASTVVSIIIAVAGFCMTGISIICARCVGNGDKKVQTSIFTTSMVFATALSVILTICIIAFAPFWSSLVGAKGNLLPLSTAYVRGYGIGILPGVLVSSIYPIMQLDGDKKRMIVAFMAMSVTDIILDILNGYVLHWGLFGMGLATSISAFVALAILLGHFFKENNLFEFKLSSFSIKYVGEIIVLGYMYIVKQLMMTLLNLIYNNYLLNFYDADHVAVYTAVYSAGSLFLCLGMALGSSVSVLTGVYAGEEDGNAIRRLLKVSVYYSVIMNAVVTVVSLVFAGPLISFYFKDAGDLYTVAVNGFRMYCLVMIVRSINLCIRGYYQTMKMQKLTLGFSALHTFLCSLIALLVLSPLVGINGVWLSFVIGEIAALIFLIVINKMVNKTSGDGLDFMLYLPENFELENSQICECTLHSMDDVVNYSSLLQEFCLQQGAPPSQANALALAIEEIAGNIVRYGFADKKSHSIDVRIIRKDEDWILRFRDDCVEFNPLKYLEENEPSTDHVGLRLIEQKAKEFQYTYTLNMNNIIIRI